jgi:hypothetical protein
MTRHRSTRVRLILLMSVAAVLGGAMIAAARRRQRRPRTPLVVGNDWQPLATQPIASEPPVRFGSRPGCGGICDADGSTPSVVVGPYRPIMHRGAPTDDGGTRAE